MTVEDLRAILKAHRWTLKRKSVRSRGTIHFYAVRRRASGRKEVYLCTMGNIGSKLEEDIVAKLPVD